MLSEEYFYTDYRPGDPLPIPETAEEEEMVVEKAVFDLRAGKEIHPYLREIIRENNLCPEIEYEENCAREEEEMEEECRFYMDHGEPIPSYILDNLPEELKDRLPEWALNGEAPPKESSQTEVDRKITHPSIPYNPANQSSIAPSQLRSLQDGTPPPYPYIPASSAFGPSRSHWQPTKTPVQSMPPVTPFMPVTEMANPYKTVKPLKEIVVITEPTNPSKYGS